MKMATGGVDLSLYAKALPLYGRNLGVALPPLAAAIVTVLLSYISGPLTDPVGGTGGGIFGIISYLVFGFAFGISVIFADDAWRHGRASIVSAWHEARRKLGSILLATLGFYFVIYVAGLVGGLIGGFVAILLTALAAFGLIYAIPAASMGGIGGTYALNRSIQLVKAAPLATAILTIVSIVVFFYVGQNGPEWFAAYAGAGAGYTVLKILLPALAAGYVALIVAKQYADIAFGRRW